MLFKEETKLLKKYGLDWESMDGDDARDIFDTLPHNAFKVVEKYIGPSRINEFMSDLNAFIRKETIIFDQFVNMAKMLGLSGNEVDMFAIKMFEAIDDNL